MDCVGHTKLCANTLETGPLHYPPVKVCYITLCSIHFYRIMISNTGQKTLDSFNVTNYCKYCMWLLFCLLVRNAVYPTWCHLFAPNTIRSRLIRMSGSGQEKWETVVINNNCHAVHSSGIWCCITWSWCPVLWDCMLISSSRDETFMKMNFISVFQDNIVILSSRVEIFMKTNFITYSKHPGITCVLK